MEMPRLVKAACDFIYEPAYADWKTNFLLENDHRFIRSHHPIRVFPISDGTNEEGLRVDVSRIAFDD
jgi:hypothetical protein